MKAAGCAECSLPFRTKFVRLPLCFSANEMLTPPSTSPF